VGSYILIAITNSLPHGTVKLFLSQDQCAYR